MFTTIDKALVAIVMGILSVLNLLFNINLGIDPEILSSVFAALTPVLVWAIPNRS